jgi:hypothetical protein
MENQHRELKQDEIDLMNEVKQEGARINILIDRVKAHLRLQAGDAREAEEIQRIAAAEPQRWAAMARTKFQEGLMDLTRAIAQPESF